jgi:hypothetical protein
MRHEHTTDRISNRKGEAGKDTQKQSHDAHSSPTHREIEGHSILEKRLERGLHTRLERYPTPRNVGWQRGIKCCVFGANTTAGQARRAAQRDGKEANLIGFVGMSRSRSIPRVPKG